MRKLTTVVAVTMLAAGGAAGCSALGRQAFVQPVVAFQDVRVNGLGLTGGSLDIVLGISNPNGYRLDATRITYRLLVDSTEFGTGAVDRTFTVQANDSTTVRLPLDFKWAGLDAAVRQIMNSGSVPYRVMGDITVGTAVGSFTIPYDRTGRFSTLAGASR